MYLVILVFMAIMIMIDHDRSCTTHHAILNISVLEHHVFGNFSFYGDHDHFDDR